MHKVLFFSCFEFLAKYILKNDERIHQVLFNKAAISKTLYMLYVWSKRDFHHIMKQRVILSIHAQKLMKAVDNYRKAALYIFFIPEEANGNGRCNQRRTALLHPISVTTHEATFSQQVTTAKMKNNVTRLLFYKLRCFQCTHLFKTGMD